MYIDLKCCDAEKPIGVEKPDFSWIVCDCDDTMQTAYRIIVFEYYNHDKKRIVWDTKKVNSGYSYHVEYQGEKLKPNTMYYWQVTVYTEKHTIVSNITSFITGLFDFTDVNWISPTSDINSPFIYKEFELENINEYATVNICGLGFFELYINGKKVSDEFMSPARTDYDTVNYENLAYPYFNTTRKSVFYLTYEVAQYLRAGKNNIVVWLGNGWYKQRGRFVEGLFDYGDELKMFLKLTNGNNVIDSDCTWQYTKSPILYDNIFYGELYDSNIHDLTSEFKSCNDDKYVHIATPPSGTIKSQMCPADRAIETSMPKLIAPNIYDATMCLTGLVRISVSGKKGDKVEIYYSEQLNDDYSLDFTSTVGYVESDKNQIQKDVYILSGNKEEIYMPRFVWHAFRYFSISVTAGVRIRSVSVHHLCTDVKKRTYFKCSENMLNNLHKICTNTLRYNIHGGVPMDCPHRERLGYTGDGQSSSLSVMYNFDAYSLYTKWIDDILDTQNQDTGFVAHTAPFNGGGGGPAWGSAVAVVPWNLYMQYGDKNILKKCEEPIRKWIIYLSERKTDGLISREESGSWCLGDWVMPSKYPWSEPHLDEIKIPSELVNTVYYIYCIDIYINILRILHKKKDVWFIKERDDSVLALNKTYLNRFYAEGKQGSDVFPLFADIVPETDKQGVLNHLIKTIENKKYCFDTGLLGTNILFDVLDKYNRNDIAMKMLLNDKYPSYGHFIKNGATTLWETWEGNGSQNHTALSSIDAWFFYGLAGIKPNALNGGYKNFSIKPFFAKELTHLDVKLKCEYGVIDVCWVKNGKNIDLNVKIPFNTTAELILPDEKLTLKAGNHKLSVKL